METQLISPESRALTLICREWNISFGAVAFVVVVSLWVNPLWMPLVELVIAMALALFGPGWKLTPGKPCGRINLVTIYTLVLTALVSFGINVAFHTEFIHRFFDVSTLNHSIPYITSLVLFPIYTVLPLLLSSKTLYTIHRRNCHLHNHYNPSQPMFGRLVHGVYSSLMKRLAMFSAIITVVDWAYYFICYSNSHINSPDRFFFFVVPAAIYLWSAFYIRQAYSILAVNNGRRLFANAEAVHRHTDTVTDTAILRLMIVRDSCLLLNVSEEALTHCNVDTPYIETRPLSFKGNVDDVRTDFENATGITAFKIKKLYVDYNHTNNNTVYHYLITIDNEARLPETVKGTWVPLDGVDRMLKMGVVSPQFAAEIFRVYTMTMSWKTYDRNGRRRFPIRNYRPNFRLNDLHGYDVDYEDTRWLRVSKINQDKPLWFLRRYLLR